MVVSTATVAALVGAGSTAAVTAVTGDALVALVGATVTAGCTLAGVVVATSRKRTEPAAPRAKTPDVVTIPRRRYDELLRAEERDRQHTEQIQLHAEEQRELHKLREDRDDP